MNAAVDRLRLLRQQAGNAAVAPRAATCATQPTRPAVPTSGASIADLRRMLGLRDRVARVPARACDRTLPGEEIADGLRLVEQRFAWPNAPAATRISDRDDTVVDARRVLAFDTETTGLAGGTGTRAFMLGAADWVDGTVRIRQLCITTLAAEVPMLRTFAGWLAPDTVLVSYNGRSYDAPLLRTRCRLARLPDMLAELQHADLLHPTRRRYKGRWENCRLATIERHLLDIVREDDLPGSEAPGAWLGYLRGGSAALLRRVFEHNAQDVRTLLLLLCRLHAWTAADG